MEDLASVYPVRSTHRLIAERLVDSDPPMELAVVAAARVLTARRLCDPLQWVGDPPREVDLTPEAVIAHLAEVREARRRAVPAVMRFADRADRPSLAIFLEYDAVGARGTMSMWFSLPAPVLADPGAQQFTPTFGDVCSAFGAFHGYVEDDRLMMVYRGSHASERARKAVPPELRQYIPEPRLPWGSNVLPLLVPQSFDRRRVPDAIWWLNFWDAVQVETVGRDRVMRAGFTEILPQPDDALVLKATHEITDVGNAEQCAQLASLVAAVGLRELQEQHRNE